MLDEPFSVDTARSLGVGPASLRARRMYAPFFGVRGPAPADGETAEASVRRRAAAFAVRMGTNEMFCLVAACVLWGAPLPRWIFTEQDAVGDARERALDVGVVLPTRAPRGRGVRGRSIVPGHAHRMIEPATGYAVTSPASTWAMMGALLGLEDLVALGDHFVREPMRPGDPPALATLAQLEHAMDAGRRVGISTLREALPLVRTRSRSRQETRTRLTLVHAGLPEPRLNWPVVVGGQVRALLDLAYPERMLAFEYEGEHHLVDPEQWAADIARLEMLADLGWRVIRVTKGDLGMRRDEFVARARRAFRALG